MLLYGSGIWVVTRAMLKVLEGFYHRAARRIMGMTAKHVADGEWEYPPEVVAIEAAGLHPIQEFIQRRQVTILEQVVCCPIYELCIELDRRPGMSRMMRWWYQDVVNESEE